MNLSHKFKPYPSIHTYPLVEALTQNTVSGQREQTTNNTLLYFHFVAQATIQ